MSCFVILKLPVAATLVVGEASPKCITMRYKTSQVISRLKMITVPLRETLGDPYEEVFGRAGENAKKFYGQVVRLGECQGIFTLFDNGFVVQIPPDKRDQLDSISERLIAALKSSYDFKKVVVVPGPIP